MSSKCLLHWDCNDISIMVIEIVQYLCYDASQKVVRVYYEITLYGGTDRWL